MFELWQTKRKIKPSFPPYALKSIFLSADTIHAKKMQMAVCKTGHKVLYSSQLNSLAVHLSLLEQTNCNHMFSAVGVNVSDIIRSRPMTAHAVPELEDLLDLDDKVPHFPYTKTFEEAAQDPCAYYD